MASGSEKRANVRNVKNQIIYSLKENSRVALIGLCDIHFFPIFVKTEQEDQKKVASKTKEKKNNIFTWKRKINSEI